MTNIVALVEELGDEAIDGEVRQPIREARQRYRHVDTRLVLKGEQARREAIIAAANFLCEEGVPQGIRVQEDLPQWTASALESTAFWQSEFGRHISASTGAENTQQGGPQGLFDVIARVVQSKAEEAYIELVLGRQVEQGDREELMEQCHAAYQCILPEFANHSLLRVYARRWREVVLAVVHARKQLRRDLLEILGSTA